ncbi:hypothetical protein BJ741DRAFT_366666 [Chytriomyces cf. hyalinus JEL632]|nr:hypothetical protein BJ741DRAFT_366666 [Chytriomyces cf. hyalinus JEL632]
MMGKSFKDLRPTKKYLQSQFTSPLITPQTTPNTNSMDTKRTTTRPKTSGTAPSTASSTGTARKASVAKPATPQPPRSAATPTPPATSTKTAKKPGPPATSTSTSSASKASSRVSTPVPASSTPAKSAAAGKKAVVIERVDASTDTIDLNDGSSQATPGNEEENETPAQTITRLAAQLAALSESESSLKNALDARDIEFYMLRSEYDTHLANAESKQSSFASELNSESVFETLQAENQTLQRQLSAMRREMAEAVDAVKSEMSSRESSLQDDLEIQLESLSVENATLKSNIAAQTAQLQSLLQELTHIKESNHAKDFELARSARDYLTLQQQVSRASMVEAAKLDELEFARESIESGRSRIRELEQHLEACLNELKVVRLEMLALSKSKSVEDSHQSNAVGTDGDLLLQLQQLQEARLKDDEQLSALEKRVVELSQERDSLLSQVATTNDSADTREQNEQENSKLLEAQINTLILERDELANLVEKGASEATAAIERAISAQSSLAATSQTAATERSVADAPPSVHWAAAKAAELEVEMEALRKTSEQDREAALQAASSIFEAEKAALLSELATLKATHEQSIEELNQKFEALASANAQQPAEDAADSSNLRLLQTRMEALESELMSAQDESTVQMTQFTQEKASLLQQVEKLTEEVSKLTASFSLQTESLKETLTAQFETNKNVAIAAAIAEMEVENSNLTQQIYKLEATHSQERTALDSVQSGDVDALAKRATEAESRVEALMAERAELSTATQREYAESEELLVLRKEVETLRETQKLELAALKSLQSAASELTAPHPQIATLEANLHQAIVDAKSAKERASLLENAHHQILSQLETTQAESQTLKISQYQHISQISDLESRVESLNSDLAEAHVQLTSLSSTHTLLVEQHGDLQTNQIDQEIAKGSLADQELNAAKRELQAAVAESAQLGAQLQSATEKLLAEGEKVVALERQVEVLAGANKMERSDAFLATRRLALDAANSVEDRLMAFEKLVSELEVQLVTKVRSPPPSPGVLSADIPSVE